ncbi:small nuclear RNA activating complex, polypeptide 3 [Coelomomyces lativittatus]|nr:small nuclear RNA activating complex, polypeptide 3 [Coelomomyces lativittatus]KAJ1511398.1 small nuclear RNA activating complex, polypeptide 3 [Coelomomyces lativittatus]
MLQPASFPWYLQPSWAQPYHALHQTKVDVDITQTGSSSSSSFHHTCQTLIHHLSQSKYRCLAPSFYHASETSLFPPPPPSYVPCLPASAFLGHHAPLTFSFHVSCPSSSSSTTTTTRTSPHAVFEVQRVHASYHWTLLDLAMKVQCGGPPPPSVVFGDVSPSFSSTPWVSLKAGLTPPLKLERETSWMLVLESILYVLEPGNPSEEISQFLLTWSHRYHVQLTLASLTTPLSQLTLRIHQPYMYIHQNGCEHMFMLQSIRYPTPSYFTSNTFTSTVFSPYLFQVPQCQWCHVRPIKFMTYGDRYSGFNPCRWCEECYHTLHYDAVSHTLVYDDFQVFEVSSSTSQGDINEPVHAPNERPPRSSSTGGSSVEEVEVEDDNDENQGGSTEENDEFDDHDDDEEEEVEEENESQRP